MRRCHSLRAPLLGATLALATGCGLIDYEGVPRADAAAPTDASTPRDADARDADARDADSTRDAAAPPTDCKVRLGAARETLCAILPGDGTTLCWGDGTYGTVGHGVFESATSPQPVGLAGPAVHVGGGRYAVCAALASGAVQCWGENEQGQLGDGGASGHSATPIDLPGLSDIVEIGMNAVAGCVRDAGGQVYCWGASPAPLDGLDDAIQLGSMGGSTWCVIRADRTAWCWGNNTAGQVGDGTTAGRGAPVPVVGLGPVSHIQTREFTSCAVTEDSAVFCWGENTNGELGIGTTGDGSPTPVPVQTADGDLTGAVEVSIGIDFACALMASGEVYCWGSNDRGQLGRGEGTSDRLAAPVTGLPFATAITTAAFTGCAAALDGDVWCWGNGGAGQLGNGARTSSSVPVRSFPACGGS